MVPCCGYPGGGADDIVVALWMIINYWVLLLEFECCC